MSLKTFAAGFFAKYVVHRTKKWSSRPVGTQQKVLKSLIGKAKRTQFGTDHNFERITTPAQFAKNVPVRDYEQLRPYIERTVAGEKNILWPGKPIYFAKTSGTTSGAKYIPITKGALPYHTRAARDAILHYIAETGNKKFVDGKMIFLQGSPKMTEKNGIKFGRLSGIVAHYVPAYLQRNRLPSWETNCIADWEKKVDAIVEETKAENMTVISGIPSWVQMYFERLIAATGKKVEELFPNFDLFIYGGVNYGPYRSKFNELMGRKVDSIELFPASEGFFAFQDTQREEGLLLLLNSGIYYEFIKAEEFFTETPKRFTIGEVKKGVNYVMIVSTNAGLWAYNVGDTVQFTSLAPHRVIVSGRIKHFISAFGEHVIGKEVEQAMKAASKKMVFSITEFTVAPQTDPPKGQLPYHEWLVEFDTPAENIEALSAMLDSEMKAQNSYYFDLIEGKILQPLVVTVLRKGSFKEYMKSQGKLGGQNKAARLSNDRKVANALLQLQL